jgi:hypothetical protein
MQSNKDVVRKSLITAVIGQKNVERVEVREVERGPVNLTLITALPPDLRPG